MKQIHLILLAAGSAALAACATQAAPATLDTADIAAPSASADAEAQAPRRSARGHSKDAFFEKYDTDDDGQVTEAEFLAERETGYRRRDADSDGAVYSEEYVSEYETRLIAQLEDQHKRQVDQAEFRFTVLDKDEDGVLSLDEFNASGTRMFETLDTNGDGTIDAADTEDSY